MNGKLRGADPESGIRSREIPLLGVCPSGSFAGLFRQRPSNLQILVIG